MKAIVGPILMLGMVSPLWVFAADKPAKAEKVITDTLKAAIPQLPIENLKPSLIEGLYEVELANGERIFTTADGKRFIAGDLFEIGAEGLQNLTEIERDNRRAAKLAAISDSEKIIFSPENVKASVTVFTDIDCGYCRKLHAEMADYLDHGIEIKYLAFPRAGVNSDSYTKTVSAWCADDRQDAITTLKLGQSVPAKTCDNPVAKQYRVGNEIGVTGTPAMVLESGKLVAGYIPAARLAQLLGI